jgi:hypothetical protein
MQEDKNMKSVQQEELFNKIKGELFTSLSDNFRKVEAELSTLKASKQSYEEQIQSLLKGISKPSSTSADA